MRRKSFLSNPAYIVPIAKPDKIYETSAPPKDDFYARPHLFPLPSAFAFRSGAIASKHSEDGQERTLLRTIFKHLDAGRANTADSELEVGRKTIHLLLGET
jgi:hypothetical protein